jgi:hypothetical protein
VRGQFAMGAVLPQYTVLQTLFVWALAVAGSR